MATKEEMQSEIHTVQQLMNTKMGQLDRSNKHQVPNNSSRPHDLFHHPHLFINVYKLRFTQNDFLFEFEFRSGLLIRSLQREFLLRGSSVYIALTRESCRNDWKERRDR